MKSRLSSEVLSPLVCLTSTWIQILDPLVSLFHRCYSHIIFASDDIMMI